MLKVLPHLVSERLRPYIDADDREVLAAYVPAQALFHDHGLDEAMLADVAAAIAERRPGDGIFGLGLEIGSGSIKLLARQWRGCEGTTLANIKLQVPARHETGTYVVALDRLIDVFSTGLRLIPPGQLDVAAPEGLFAGFAAPEDFACVYGTHALRVLAREDGAGPPARVRVLTGDEEGLTAFQSIVPEVERAHPGVVAVEIGSGSTEIVRTDGDGRPWPLTLGLGGKTADPHLGALRRFMATGSATPRIREVLESSDEAVTAFFAPGMPEPTRVFINPSRASVAFRAFARARQGEGDMVALDEDLVETYRRKHGADRFGAKAAILMAILRGLGVAGFREGRRGGLKMGVAALLARGLARFRE